MNTTIDNTAAIARWSAQLTRRLGREDIQELFANDVASIRRYCNLVLAATDGKSLADKDAIFIDSVAERLALLFQLPCPVRRLAA